RPFRTVGRPDADTVAGLETQRQETCSELIDAPAELLIGPAAALVHGDQHFPFWPFLDGAAERFPDGVFEQGRLDGAAHQGWLLAHGSLLRSEISTIPNGASQSSIPGGLFRCRKVF